MSEKVPTNQTPKDNGLDESNNQTIQEAGGNDLPSSVFAFSITDDNFLEDSVNPGETKDVIYGLATGGERGIVTVNADGSVIYEPDEGFIGVDSFVITVDDGSGNVVERVFNIWVNPVEDNNGSVVETVFNVWVSPIDDVDTYDIDNGDGPVVTGSGVLPTTLSVFQSPVPEQTTRVFEGMINTGSSRMVSESGLPTSFVEPPSAEEGDIVLPPMRDPVPGPVVPVNSVPGTQSVDEDMVLTISGIRVSDPGGNLAYTQLSVGNGSLTVDLSGGARILSGANSSPTLTLSGTETQINAALATVSYIGNADFHGIDTLTVLSAESGGIQSTDTVAITVVSIDDGSPAISDFTDNTTSITGTDAQVLESDLSSGSNAAGTGETTTGTFTLSTPDGLTSLQVGSMTLTAAQLAATSSSAVMITGSNGTLSITGFNSGTGVVSYSYTLTSAATDVDNAIESDSFALTLTETDGQTSTSNLLIGIVDDTPTAVADTNSVTEGTATAQAANITGNVLTDSADTLGADGAASGGAVSGIVAGSGTPGVLSNPVTGMYGALSINADGSYSYDLDDSNASVNGLGAGDSLMDTFTYQITDGDGDSSTTTLTITINGADDGAPTINGLTDNTGVIAGTDAQVLESDLSSGSNAAGTGETTTGTFTLSTPDGLTSLQVGGTTIMAAQLAATSSSPVTITGSNGTLSITGFNSGTGVVNYSYTLTSATTDVGNATMPETDSFALTLTEADSQTTTSNLLIGIVDDTPTAVADTNIVIEGIDPAQAANITGNVLTDNADILGADGAASGGAVSGIAAGSGTLATISTTPVAGAYGALTINADGSYSYDLDDNNTAVNALISGESLMDTFTYQITDGDGDTATTTLTITINGSNDGGPNLSGLIDNNVNIPGTDAQVLESDLSSGSNAAGTGETTTGTFTLSTPDGLTSLQVGGMTLTAAQLAATSSSPMTITGSNGTLSITGFTSGTGVVNYSYTLAGATTDVGNATTPETDSFALTLTETDGQTTTSNLLIGIVDDTPTAVADTNSVTEGTSTAAANITGNVLTDSADTLGADGAASGGAVSGIVAGSGTPVALSNPVTGMYGALTINADGSYSYDLDDSNATVNGLGAGDSLTDTFTYQITDGDGDSSTTTLTITINGADDGAPTINDLIDNNANIPGTDAQVLESDLSNGSNAAGTGETTAGTFTLSTPDGLTSLQVGGTTLTAAQLAATSSSAMTITGINGTLSITGFNSGTGAVSYSYTLAGATTDVDNAIESDSFALTLTEADGQTTTFNLLIGIVDDIPTAVADTNSVTEGTSAAAANITGNVLTDSADTLGADGAASGGAVSGIVAGSGTPVALSNPVTGMYGALTINADGSYSYDLDDSNATVNGLGAGDSLMDTFTYQITDGDGDSSTTTLTITINGADDGAPTINNLIDNNANIPGTDAQVLESDLSSGSNAMGTGETTTGTFTLSTPDGLTSLQVGSMTLTAAQLAATSSSAMTITGSNGTLSITGFNSGTGAVSYSYTLTSAATDVSNVIESDSFALTLTEADGQTIASNLLIGIVDDTPTAVADTNSVTEGTSAAAANITGNVLTDSADALGADGGAVSGIVAGSGTPGALSNPVTGMYGALSINADGSYSYDLDDSNAAVNGLGAGGSLTDTFTYQITDGDGDSSTTTLTITINGADDGAPTINNLIDNNANIPGTDAQVLESDLSNGSNAAGTGETTTGMFTLSTPDGLTSLQVGGTTIMAAQLAATSSSAMTITGSNGTLSITGFDSGTGVVNYSYTLAGATTDVGNATTPETDNFALTLTETDGQTSTSNLLIGIVDDTPTAVADTNSVTEGTATAQAANITGNVLTDSADTWVPMVAR